MPWTVFHRLHEGNKCRVTQPVGQFTSKQQAFLEFVLAHYVGVGVDEFDPEKLTLLLRLK